MTTLYSDEEDLSHDYFADVESDKQPDFINTSLGSMSRKRVEQIFLNGGGLKIAVKSRTYRFKEKCLDLM